MNCLYILRKMTDYKHKPFFYNYGIHYLRHSPGY